MKSSHSLFAGLILIVAIVIITFFINTEDRPQNENNIDIEMQESAGEEATFSEVSMNIPENVLDTLNQESILVDTQRSSLAWTAQKQIVRTWVDTGTINLAQGNLILGEDGNLDGGAFIVDMTSISVDNTGRGSGNAQLEGHLSSADFFDVQNHPFATFIITDVEGQGGAMNITGEMTIKNITQEISFSASMNTGDEALTFNGDIIIDRSLFDVRFGSPSFFNNLGDNAIDDEFRLEVELVTVE